MMEKYCSHSVIYLKHLLFCHYKIQSGQKKYLYFFKTSSTLKESEHGTTDLKYNIAGIFFFFKVILLLLLLVHIFSCVLTQYWLFQVLLQKYVLLPLSSLLQTPPAHKTNLTGAVECSKFQICDYARRILVWFFLPKQKWAQQTAAPQQLGHQQHQLTPRGPPEKAASLS